MRAVITGGPSVGKTTIIQQLCSRGFYVVEEFATQIIKEGVFLPWIDRVSFQAEVLRRQVAAESSITDFEKPVFLDRGLFDGEAYYIYDKIDIPAVFSTMNADHYSLAFLVEPLPFFDANDVRRENLEFTKEISVILENCYRSRNVTVVRVPAMAPVERADFVLDEVEKFQKARVSIPVNTGKHIRSRARKSALAAI